MADVLDYLSHGMKGSQVQSFPAAPGGDDDLCLIETSSEGPARRRP